MLIDGCHYLQFIKLKNKDAAEACLKYAGWDDKAKAKFRERIDLIKE
ncbi:hypothetical protein [Dapis sp. BLCC M229]